MGRSRNVLLGPAHQFVVCNNISNKNIKVRGPIRYGMQYSSTRQFFLVTALLLLRRGFCTLVLFIIILKITHIFVLRYFLQHCTQI